MIPIWHLLILMEYDAKKDLLTYRFDDDRVAKGKHVFLLVVKDQKGNESRFEYQGHS